MAGEGQGAILSLGIELAGRQGWVTDIRACEAEWDRLQNKIQLGTSIGGGTKFLPGTGYVGGGVGGYTPLLTGPGMGYAPSYQGGGIQPYRPSPNFTYGGSYAGRISGAGEPGGSALDIGNYPIIPYGIGGGVGGGGVPPRTTANRWDFGGDEDKIKKMSKAFQDHSESVNETGINYQKLALRAIAVIPIWMGLRAAFQAVTSTISDGFKYWEDLDTAIAKMGAVTQGVENIPEFMAKLRNEVKSLSAETGKSVNDVADTYYRFAETGMKGTVRVCRNSPEKR